MAPKPFEPTAEEARRGARMRSVLTVVCALCSVAVILTGVWWPMAAWGAASIMAVVAMCRSAGRSRNQGAWVTFVQVARTPSHAAVDRRLLVPGWLIAMLGVLLAGYLVALALYLIPHV